MQPIVHKTLYGKPETKGTPVSKGLAGAIGTVPEAQILWMAGSSPQKSRSETLFAPVFIGFQ